MAPLGWYSAQPLHLAAGLPHFLFPEDTVKAATSNRITHGLPFAPLLTEHPLLLGILSRIHAFFSSTNAYQASGPVAQWPSGWAQKWRLSWSDHRGFEIVFSPSQGWWHCPQSCNESTSGPWLILLQVVDFTVSSGNLFFFLALASWVWLESQWWELKRVFF